MKTEFELEISMHNPARIVKSGDTISIIGQAPKHKPYVSITVAGSNSLFIQDADLETFAVNILKALKSNKLK